MNLVPLQGGAFRQLTVHRMSVNHWIVSARISDGQRVFSWPTWNALPQDEFASNDDFVKQAD